MTQKHTNNRMRKKSNDLGLKYTPHQKKKHNEKGEWMNNMTKELEGLKEGPKAEIHIDLHKRTLKISNWKTPGHDGIHGFSFKKFTPHLHDRLALGMKRCLQGAHVSEWMTKGKITLIQKDPLKGTAPNNYRPIPCSLIMWKILTV